VSPIGNESSATSPLSPHAPLSSYANECNLLQHQIDSLLANQKLLFTQLEEVRKALEQLAATYVTTPSPAVSTTVTPTGHLRAFWKGLDEENEWDDLVAMCDKIQVTHPLSMHRLGEPRGPTAPPRPLILTFATTQHCRDFISKMYQSTNGLLDEACSIRPDYSPEELACYKSAWKQAIDKNNAARKRIYTVRNCQLVQLKESTGTWIVKESICRKS